MNVEELNTLSYKDLQARAKQLSIAANQKKDILIEEILAKIFTDNCENVPQKANIVEIAVPSTPSVSKSLRVTRSTVKKAAVVQAPIEVVTIVEAPIEEPEVVVKDTEVVEEKPEIVVEQIPEGVSATPVAESSELAPADEQVEEIEYPAPTTLFEDEREPIEEMYEEEFYEEEYQEIEQDVEVELEEEHVGLEIKGQKIAINRHVYFTSPDAKNPAVAVVAKQGQKHMHFASPDVQVGQKVHWRYEDYNNEESSTEAVQEQPETAEEAAVTAQMAGMKLSPGHNDRVMSFWLTKAFANPVGGFFNK